MKAKVVGRIEKTNGRKLTPRRPPTCISLSRFSGPALTRWISPSNRWAPRLGPFEALAAKPARGSLQPAVQAAS